MFLVTVANAWAMVHADDETESRLERAGRLLDLLVHDPALAAEGSSASSGPHLDRTKLDRLTLADLRHLHLPDVFRFTVHERTAGPDGARVSGNWTVGESDGESVAVSRPVAIDSGTADRPVVRLGTAVVALA